MGVNLIFWKGQESKRNSNREHDVDTLRMEWCNYSFLDCQFHDFLCHATLNLAIFCGMVGMCYHDDAMACAIMMLPASKISAPSPCSSDALFLSILPCHEKPPAGHRGPLCAPVLFFVIFYTLFWHLVLGAFTFSSSRVVSVKPKSHKKFKVTR